MTGGSAFLASPLPGAGETLTLDPRESRHAAAARRLSAGECIRLVDGQGGVAEGRIESVAAGASGVTVRIVSRGTEPPPEPAVHLAAALPKGDRQAVMLDMCAQLGLRRFTPLECRRAVVRPARVNPSRLRRVLEEACKQSGISHVPALGTAAAPGAISREAVAAGDLVVALEPGAPPLRRLLAREGITPGGRQVTLLVGPEGGFDDGEMQAMRDTGALAASLTDSVLRVETAAVCAVTLVRTVPVSSIG